MAGLGPKLMSFTYDILFENKTSYSTLVGISSFQKDSEEGNPFKIEDELYYLGHFPPLVATELCFLSRGSNLDKFPGMLGFREK